MDANFICYAAGGTAWAIVYIAAVVIGVRKRTYCIPLPAIALNIVWEAIGAAYFLPRASDLSDGIKTSIIVAWLILDLVIAWTYLKYGRSIHYSTCAVFALVMVSALLLEFSFVFQFGFFDALRYTAFLGNFIMSILFVHDFLERDEWNGSSMTIAIGKAIGTLPFTVIYGFVGGAMFIALIGVGIAIWDVLYIGLLLRRRASGRQHVLSENPSQGQLQHSSWT